MKRLLVFLVLVFGCVANAAVPITDIRFDTVGPQAKLAENLRSWFTQVNADTSAGSVNVSSGTTFYVDSVNGSDTRTGLSWTLALATLDAAINKCTADSGDNILIAAKHAETIAAANGWDADVAGITIEGLGSGSDAPTFTFTATGSTVAIGAANVVVKNCRFLAGVSEVVAGIIVEAAGDHFAIVGCEFPEPLVSTYEFDIAIQLTTGANDVSVVGCEAYSADAVGATHFINGGAAVVGRFTAAYNLIHGEYLVAAIFSDQIDLEGYIAYNTITNMTTGQHCIEYTTTATGTIEHNSFYTDAEGTTLDPGSMKCIENYVTTAINASAVIVPAYDDTTENLIGVDDADNAAATTSVVANSDGSVLERLEQIDVDTSAVLVDTAVLQPMAEQSASFALTTIVSGNNDIFVVGGGPVKIIELVGIVTTQIEAKSCLINYNMDPTSPAGDTAFGTDGGAVEINGDTVGALYTWDGVIANDLTATDNGVALGVAAVSGLVVPAGSLELAAVVATSATGEITFYIRYIPLVSGATVTAAP